MQKKKTWKQFRVSARSPNMKYKDSWLIEDNYLIKITDKSFFFEPSTGVPQQMVLEWFTSKKLFDGTNESRLNMILQGLDYEARVILNKADRVVMHFDRKFIHHIRALAGFAYDREDLNKKHLFKTFDYPLVKFTYNDNKILVSVCKSNSDENNDLRRNHDCKNEEINLFVYGNIQKSFVLVDPPIIAIKRKATTSQKTRKPYKPDYVAQQLIRSKIGLDGELLVCELIKAQLESKYKSEGNSSIKINHVAVTDDSKGYDIEIHNQDGTVIYIEVKTTKSSINTPFYITENELKFSEENDGNYYLYRLFDFNYSKDNVKYYVIKGNLRNQLDLYPIQYVSYPKS